MRSAQLGGDAELTAETDAKWMRAVGLYPGAALPHPGDCGCSQHPRPCPHDLLQTRVRPFGAAPTDPGARVTKWCLRCGEDQGISAPVTPVP